MDISGFGLRARLVASTTYPVGVSITRFADDTDPLDAPVVTAAEVAMGLNGDLVAWNSPNPRLVTLAVIPGSDEDRALAMLVEANTAARGRMPARDRITLTVIYPDGRQTTLSEGVVLTGSPILSVASAGRYKTRVYQYAFEGQQSS